MLLNESSLSQNAVETLNTLIYVLLDLKWLALALKLSKTLRIIYFQV